MVEHAKNKEEPDPAIVELQPGLFEMLAEELKEDEKDDFTCVKCKLYAVDPRLCTACERPICANCLKRAQIEETQADDLESFEMSD